MLVVAFTELEDQRGIEPLVGSYILTFRWAPPHQGQQILLFGERDVSATPRYASSRNSGEFC